MMRKWHVETGSARTARRWSWAGWLSVLCFALGQVLVPLHIAAHEHAGEASDHHLRVDAGHSEHHHPHPSEDPSEQPDGHRHRHDSPSPVPHPSEPGSDHEPHPAQDHVTFIRPTSEGSCQETLPQPTTSPERPDPLTDDPGIHSIVEAASESPPAPPALGSCASRAPPAQL